MFALTLAAICLPQVAAGGAYTALPGDRVLLMNDDTRVEAGVRGQGINALALDGVTPRWTQVTTADLAVEHTLYNLNKLDKLGTLSEGTEWYHTDEAGNRTWHLVNVRMGNVFDGEGGALGATHNYLPWQTDTAMDYRDGTAGALNQFAAGQIVMRNVDGAQVVSPLYAEGIGRIYFDAVNFDTATPNTLKLEISTVDNTDEAAADWQPALVDVLAYVDGVYEETLSSFGQDTAVLAMTTGGSTGNFYRIVLNADSGFVNYRGPARFRIVRTCSVSEGEGAEIDGMAILDNIVCSYPAMSAEIVPAGAFDPALTGENVLGWVGSLQDPDDPAALPYYGSTTFKPLATVNPLVNSAVDSPAVDVADAQFHYRWRYLAQYLMGGNCTATNSSESTATDQANLSGGAVLNLPTVDESFASLPAVVSCIWLGNTASANASQIQRIGVKVGDVEYLSNPVNGSGSGTANGKYVDNSWVQQYEFATPFEIRTGKDYAITFYDKDEVEITLANTVRLVRNQEGGAIQLKPSDLAGLGNKAYNRLLGKVEYKYVGNFDSLSMTATGTQLTGAAPVDSAYTANPGDLEFYYTATIDAPYYSLVNYAGAGTGGIAANLEALTSVTTRRGVDEGFLPSRGADFFARLRYGRSELRSFKVEVRAVSDGATAEFRTSRLVDHMEWCAFLYTRTNGTERGSCEVRFSEVAKDGTVNVLEVSGWDFDSFERWPETLSVPEYAADADAAWIKLPFDGTTDFLRFRYLEDDRRIVVTRADYQNFNGWSDANRNAELFVGKTTADDSIHGVSNAQVVRASDFGFWAETPETTSEWQENFTNQSIVIGAPYTGEYNTPNGWTAGPSQYVNRQYDISGDTVALQMYGRGSGYLRLTPAARNAPAGIGEFTVSARLAQALEFNNFAYFQGDDDLGSGITLHDYTFSTRAVMGYLTEKHDGLSSMSLVANYNPDVGCYEFRVTQLNASRLYRLQLFRWFCNDAGNFEAESLGFTEYTISYPMDADVGSGSFLFPAMFISVSNITLGSTTTPAVHVTAGIQTGGTSNDYKLNAATSGKNYRCIIFNDTSDKRMTAGTFGLASVNCPGRFAQPTFYPQAATLGADNKSSATTTTDQSLTTSTFDTPTAGTQLHKTLQNNYWRMAGGWMQAYFPDGFNPDAPELTPNWGIRCKEGVGQDLILSLAEDDGKFTPVATNRVTSFELADASFQVYNTDQQSVRLSVGGAWNDRIQTDIVVADVGFTQWRGDSYTTSRQYAKLPVGSTSYGMGAYTNVIFTECWVHGAANSADRVLEMNASRAYHNASSNLVQSIRSPLFDGGKEADGFQHGIGLGMVAFSYTNCDERVNLLVQIATNNVSTSTFRDLTFNESGWETITNFSGSAVGDLGLGIEPGIPLKHSGVAACYIGLHDVTGAVRVVMDPKIVNAAQTGAGLADPKYGQIFIKNVVFRDEPGVDPAAWWGYNVRTGGYRRDPGDDLMQILEDGSETDAANFGMSVALNNSITDKTDPTDTYTEYTPFVQTPTFAYLDDSATAPEVGEIRLQARRYDSSDAVARITVYGWKESAGPILNNNSWKYLTHFDIDSDVYTNLVYQLPANTGYRSFRLAVTGVAGAGQMSGGTPTDPVVRVAFDNVLVSETVNPKVKFANVMAFHSHLTTLDKLDYANAKAEQPLAEESWGVQAEIQAFQLPEQIDWTKDITVTLYWHEGKTPWGADTNWVNKAELSKCSDCAAGEYVFRSSYAENAESVIPASMERNTIVQYHLGVSYYLKNSDPEAGPVVTFQELDPLTEWVKPAWYLGYDANQTIGSVTGGTSAYTILDNVAPGNAWINEANVFGAYDDDAGLSTIGFNNSDFTNQYVEVAIPATTDIDGWKLQFITMGGTTNTLARFSAAKTGNGYAKAEKTLNPSDGYVFLSVASPATKAAGTLDETAGQLDGVWRVEEMAAGDTAFKTKRFDSGIECQDVYDSQMYPLALQLVRASGVVEHQITLGGTNLYANLDLPVLAEQYSAHALATNLTAVAKAANQTSNWIEAGYDRRDDVAESLANSLSVSNLCGDDPADWTTTIVKTPGAKNGDQTLPPVRTAVGDSVVFYCYVGTNAADTVSGRLKQTDDPLSVPATTDRLILVVPKNSSTGTNLIYTIADYYEIAGITTNSVALEGVAGKRKSYTLEGLGSNLADATAITLNAWVRPWSELTDPDGYGLTEDNRYTDAVLDWLEKGTLLGGTPFAHPGTINPVKFIEYPSGTPEDLSLTDMYCLDIDPTAGDLFLVAGVADIDTTSKNPNTVLDFYMAISNGTTSATWAPTVLRGATPGSNTQTAADIQDWKDVALQIEAVQLNKYYKEDGSGEYDPTSRSTFIPVRWFILDGTSFDASNRTKIEIKDQHAPGTPGYYEGWNNYPANGFNYRWTLKDIDRPKAPDMLAPTNYYP